MLVNLIIGLIAMILCLFFQIALLVVVIRFYLGKRQDLQQHPTFFLSLSVIGGVMLLLVIGNLIQIAIWAWLFLSLGEFQYFSEAFYHSAVNFSTLGYGDIVMSDEHKLLGPIESINGVLMIGVSSASLLATFQDLFKTRLPVRNKNR